MADVPFPAEPGDDQVVLDVEAVALNFGEVTFHHGQKPGTVIGWDAVGTVRTGPLAGTRVVTFGWEGGWAQRRVVDVDHLAAVPDGVDLGAASTLPVAGVTALRALRRLGSVIGRRILVTGASGGVGRYAVQLAALAGAHVVAVVGSEGRGAGLAEIGAADIGAASLQPTTLDFEAARLTGGRRRIEPFAVDGTPFGPDLAYLVGLLAEGRLDPQIGWRGPWTQVSDAVEALRSRRVRGKAVLDVGA